jgi:hypothetical protein
LNIFPFRPFCVSSGMESDTFSADRSLRRNEAQLAVRGDAPTG